MVSREHGREGLPPEIPPLRITFDIDPDIIIPFEDPGKYFVIAFMPDDAPVGIVKRIIFIGVFKR